MELTEREYAQQQITLGRRIHEHDGVFWEEVYPFYCKPAFVYKAFDPAEARPARSRSWLGYSHLVVTGTHANRRLRLMVLEGDNLRGYGLSQLSSNCRSKVRRGLARCEIHLIEDLKENLERIREINISQARRQERGAGAETPLRRYTHEADEWREQIRREFSLPRRPWWGAFVGGELVAYLRVVQVEGTCVIQHVKADTEFLKMYPVYALYHTLLEGLSKDRSCSRIINGGPMHASLDHFKEQFLFEDRAYPCYSSHARLVELGKRVLRGVSRP